MEEDKKIYFFHAITAQRVPALRERLIEAVEGNMIPHMISLPPTTTSSEIRREICYGR